MNEALIDALVSLQIQDVFDPQELSTLQLSERALLTLDAPLSRKNARYFLGGGVWDRRVRWGAVVLGLGLGSVALAGGAVVVSELAPARSVLEVGATSAPSATHVAPSAPVTKEAAAPPPPVQRTKPSVERPVDSTAVKTVPPKAVSKVPAVAEDVPMLIVGEATEIVVDEPLPSHTVILAREDVSEGLISADREIQRLLRERRLLPDD